MLTRIMKTVASAGTVNCSRIEILRDKVLIADVEDIPGLGAANDKYRYMFIYHDRIILNSKHYAIVQHNHHGVRVHFPHNSNAG